MFKNPGERKRKIRFAWLKYVDVLVAVFQIKLEMVTLICL